MSLAIPHTGLWTPQRKLWRAPWWKRLPGLFAAGDRMLDSSGNKILDSSGNSLLDDGAGNGCCCDEECDSTNCTGANKSCVWRKSRVTITPSGAGTVTLAAYSTTDPGVTLKTWEPVLWGCWSVYYEYWEKVCALLNTTYHTYSTDAPLPSPPAGPSDWSVIVTLAGISVKTSCFAVGDGSQSPTDNPNGTYTLTPTTSTGSLFKCLQIDTVAYHNNYSCSGTPLERFGVPLEVSCTKVRLDNQQTNGLTCPTEDALYGNGEQYFMYFTGTYSATYTDFATTSYTVSNDYPAIRADVIGSGGTATVTFNFVATA